jgi:Rrf2 family protein
MKLSSKGRYGVRALFDIALHEGESPAQIKDIAARQEIPARFLEQIFQDLRRAGLVRSKRGPRGGYQLARPPERIRLGDVVRALDGPIRALAGEEPARRGRAGALRAERRATDEVFRDLAAQVEACFDGVSIADVVARAERMGLHRRAAERYVYAI